MTEDKPVASIVEKLAEPQIARARMRAGSSFEAEAMVTITPVGLLAIGGLLAAILLSVPPIIRAARQRVSPPPPPKLPN